jgi:hypothetical protein
MMTAIRGALKPHGRLVVIEYAKEHDEDPSAGVATMSAGDLRSEMESFGFRLVRILDILEAQHAMIFSK